MRPRAIWSKLHCTHISVHDIHFAYEDSHAKHTVQTKHACVYKYHNKHALLQESLLQKPSSMMIESWQVEPIWVIKWNMQRANLESRVLSVLQLSPCAQTPAASVKTSGPWCLQPWAMKKMPGNPRTFHIHPLYHDPVKTSLQWG